MHLPELEWQILYGRLAWAVVLAAVAAAMVPRAWRSRALAGMLLVLCGALSALPHQSSPAYWLVLAFQWPSAMLAGCCLYRLASKGAGACWLPALAAWPIALVGAALYVDALGWLSLGMYAAGFGPQGAPVVAMGAALVCVIAIARGRARPEALVLLGAVTLFSILRLPTGNLWDALLDPLLWGWAVASLCARARMRHRSPYGRDIFVS